MDRVHGPLMARAGWNRFGPLPAAARGKGQIRTNHGALAHTEFGMPATAEHEKKLTLLTPAFLVLHTLDDSLPARVVKVSPAR